MQSESKLSLQTKSSKTMILQQGPNDAALVRELQIILKSWGFYSGSIDDTFSPETSSAVIAFQKALGLNPDWIEEFLKHKSSLTVKVVVRLVQVQSQIYNPHLAISTVTSSNFYRVGSPSKISLNKTGEKYEKSSFTQCID